MLGRLWLLFVTICTLISLSTSGAMADPTEEDQRIRKIAERRPDAGLVFMEVRFFEEGSTTAKICQTIWVTVKSSEGKEALFVSQISPTHFGRAADSSSYGGWVVLDPGIYYVAHIKCDGPSGGRFPGLFARFTIQKGQVLNLGCLTVSYQRGPMTFFAPRKDSGDWKIEDLTQKAVETWTKLAPQAFSKARKQYMTAVRVKARTERDAPNR